MGIDDAAEIMRRPAARLHFPCSFADADLAEDRFSGICFDAKPASNLARIIRWNASLAAFAFKEDGFESHPGYRPGRRWSLGNVGAASDASPLWRTLSCGGEGHGPLCAEVLRTSPPGCSARESVPRR